MTPRGAPRKPTVLKLIQGNKKRHVRESKEPKLKRARLDPPAVFPDRAKDTWREIAGILHEMKVLTTADPLALEGFALTLAAYREAHEVLRERGSFSYEVTPAGGGDSTWKLYPEVGLVRDLGRDLMGYFSRFGMTPADRSRVTALEDDDKNPFEGVG